MSEDSNLKIKGFIEYLSLLSDMLTRLKDISQTYKIDPSKFQEDNELDDIFSDADPLVVGLLIKTLMRFRKLLDKPMENVDKLDMGTINEFSEMVADLKKKVMEEKS